MRGHFECEYFGPMRHGHGHHGGPFGHHGHHGHGPFGHHGHHGHHGHKHGHGKFSHHHGFGPWGHHGGPHFGMRFGPWAMDGGRRCTADGPCKRGPTEEESCRRGDKDGGRHGPEDGPFRRGPFGHFHGRRPWERPGSSGCRKMGGRKEKGCCCNKNDSKQDKATQAFVIERVIVENDPRCNSV